MASVHTQSLNKRFGSVVAVDNLSLDINDGEFLVLLGPSGCGKTTTLRLIAGLEVATDGRIRIGDHDVTHLHPRERGCAMVFQDYALYPHMTVEDNLSFGLRNLRFPRPEVEQRVRGVAEMLQIGELLDRKPRQLSGGQRQRVALGRAIVRHPDVYLFDEPLSNLDAKLRAAMRVELAELHEQLGTTSIYVTHDQVEAMTLGTRICVQKDGLLLQDASASELYNEPANTFVANFIGSPPMNLLDGRLIRDDGMWVEIDDSRFRIPESHHKRYTAHINQEVTFGIRPEDISFMSDAEASMENRSSHRVSLRVVEHLGKETLVYFNLGNQQVVASVQPGSIMNPQDVELLWNLEKMHLFNIDTGQAIR